MHEATQKSKQRLQEAPTEGMSIVSRMTGDPRKYVFEQREGERSKSRQGVERTTRTAAVNQELGKLKMQTGSKNYLPFQDQERIRKSYKQELQRRNNEFLHRQVADRQSKQNPKHKKLVEQKRMMQDYTAVMSQIDHIDRTRKSAYNRKLQMAAQR